MRAWLLTPLLASVAHALTVVPGGTLSTNTNWTLAGSPFLVQGTVTIFGAANPRLTIDAGVEVRFAPGARLVVGHDSGDWIDYRGQLSAVGTAAQPIVFTADNGASGGWGGILFSNNSDTGGAWSLLQHVVIEKATTGLHQKESAQPVLPSQLEVRQCSQGGVLLEGGSTATTLSQVFIHDNGGYGLTLSGAPLPVVSAVTLGGHADNRVAYTGTIGQDLTLDLAAWPLDVLFTGTTWVFGAAGPRLTLPAGTELRFAPGARLAIGYDSGDWTNYRGQLTAVGTAAQPILFTADNGLAGGWGGLVFTNNADVGGATSTLQHAVIERAGTNLLLQDTAQPALLRDLELRHGSQGGLELRGSSTVVALQDLDIHDNGGFGLTLSGAPLPVVGGVSLAGHADNRVAYTGTISLDLTLDLAAWPLDVLFTGTTWVFGAAGPALTLPAGTELRFAPGARLAIGYDSGDWTNYRGQLTAVGTAAQPILFTADNVLTGGWNGIFFTTNADVGGASSTLQHAVIERAGTNLLLQDTAQPALLSDLELRHGSQGGLELRGSSTVVALQDLDIHDNGGFGLTLSGAPLPAVSGVSLAGHADNRVAYTGTISLDLTLDLAAWPLDVLFTGTTWVFGPANPRLTLPAGTELRFAPAARLAIGYDSGEWTNYRGQLTAVGTAAQPILFTADNGLSGGWNGLFFTTNADVGGASSSLQHAIIEKAGTSLLLENSSQPALLADLELRGASQGGVQLVGSGTVVALQDLDIHDNGGFGLTLSGAPLPAVSGVSLAGHADNRVAYTGTISLDLTLDLAAWPLDVLFTGTTWVFGPANPRLTLPAGTELRFAPAARLAIGYDSGEWTNYRGQLTAVGTAAQPIVFTADNGLTGGWNGLFFTTNSDVGGASSRLERCRIERASTNVELRNTTQPDTLRHVTTQLASQRGLLLTASPVRVANCLVLDNATGIRVANTDTTWIGDDPALANTFLGNGAWDLYNDGAGAVQARYNGWCLEDGVTPADRIHDRMDNAAKGVVSYLPTLPVDVVRVAATFHNDTRQLDLEWCPVAGAVQYHIYESSTGRPDPAVDPVVASTTGLTHSLPVPDGNHQRYYRVTAERASRSGCR